MQCQLIRNAYSSCHLNRSFLSIGTAYGDELDFFAREGVLDCWSQVVGIDIVADVCSEVLSQPNLLRLRDRLTFSHHNLQRLPPPFGECYWDCIQCGFVLEDIEYCDKQAAYDRLFLSLRNGGNLIISEMLIHNQKCSDETDEIRQLNISKLYDFFLTEADECLARGELNDEQYHLLRGNGSGPGLLLTKRMAVDGNRDYFETREQTENHLYNAGFSSINYYPNAVIPLLGVLVAQKGK